MSIAFYGEIKELPDHPEKLLIDVRDPDELRETGAIHTSINIPYNGVVNAFSLSEDQFRDIYGRAKPSKTTPIIFSSEKGVRAGRAAAIVGAALGYENVKYYEGSWTEWAEYEGLSYGGCMDFVCSCCYMKLRRHSLPRLH